MSGLSGALIAGGASTRFGQDKASLPWKGGSLAGYLLVQMRLAGLDPLIFNGSRAIQGLPERVIVLPDEVPGQGPLGGLATVLRHAQGPVLVAACDMPGLDAEAFSALMGAWSLPLKGLVAKSRDGWQPLFGIYSPELLPMIERRLMNGERALFRMIEDQGLPAWKPPENLRLDNINTLEEWEAWKSRSEGARDQNG